MALTPGQHKAFRAEFRVGAEVDDPTYGRGRVVRLTLAGASLTSAVVLFYQLSREYEFTPGGVYDLTRLELVAPIAAVTRAAGDVVQSVADRVAGAAERGATEHMTWRHLISTLQGQQYRENGNLYREVQRRLQAVMTRYEGSSTLPRLEAIANTEQLMEILSPIFPEPWAMDIVLTTLKPHKRVPSEFQPVDRPGNSRANAQFYSRTQLRVLQNQNRAQDTLRLRETAHGATAAVGRQPEAPSAFRASRVGPPPVIETRPLPAAGENARTWERIIGRLRTYRGRRHDPARVSELAEWLYDHRAELPSLEADPDSFYRWFAENRPGGGAAQGRYNRWWYVMQEVGTDVLRDFLPERLQARRGAGDPGLQLMSRRPGDSGAALPEAQSWEDVFLRMRHSYQRDLSGEAFALMDQHGQLGPHVYRQKPGALFLLEQLERAHAESRLPAFRTPGSLQERQAFYGDVVRALGLSGSHDATPALVANNISFYPIFKESGLSHLAHELPDAFQFQTDRGDWKVANLPDPRGFDEIIYRLRHALGGNMPAEDQQQLSGLLRRLETAHSQNTLPAFGDAFPASAGKLDERKYGFWRRMARAMGYADEHADYATWAPVLFETGLSRLNYYLPRHLQLDISRGSADIKLPTAARFSRTYLPHVNPESTPLTDDDLALLARNQVLFGMHEQLRGTAGDDVRTAVTEGGDSLPGDALLQQLAASGFSPHRARLSTGQHILDLGEQLPEHLTVALSEFNPEEWARVQHAGLLDIQLGGRRPTSPDMLYRPRIEEFGMRLAGASRGSYDQRFARHALDVLYRLRDEFLGESFTQEQLADMHDVSPDSEINAGTAKTANRELFASEQLLAEDRELRASTAMRPAVGQATPAQRTQVLYEGFFDTSHQFIREGIEYVHGQSTTNVFAPVLSGLPFTAETYDPRDQHHVDELQSRLSRETAKLADLKRDHERFATSQSFRRELHEQTKRVGLLQLFGFSQHAPVRNHELVPSTMHTTDETLALMQRLAQNNPFAQFPTNENHQRMVAARVFDRALQYGLVGAPGTTADPTYRDVPNFVQLQPGFITHESLGKLLDGFDDMPLDPEMLGGFRRRLSDQIVATFRTQNGQGVISGLLHRIKAANAARTGDDYSVLIDARIGQIENSIGELFSARRRQLDASTPDIEGLVDLHQRYDRLMNESHAVVAQAQQRGLLPQERAVSDLMADAELAERLRTAADRVSAGQASADELLGLMNAKAAAPYRQELSVLQEQLVRTNLPMQDYVPGAVERQTAALRSEYLALGRAVNPDDPHAAQFFQRAAVSLAQGAGDQVPAAAAGPLSALRGHLVRRNLQLDTLAGRVLQAMPDELARMAHGREIIASTSREMELVQRQIDQLRPHAAEIAELDQKITKLTKEANNLKHSTKPIELFAAGNIQVMIDSLTQRRNHLAKGNVTAQIATLTAQKRALSETIDQHVMTNPLSALTGVDITDPRSVAEALSTLQGRKTLLGASPNNAELLARLTDFNLARMRPLWTDDLKRQFNELPHHVKVQLVAARRKALDDELEQLNQRREQTELTQRRAVELRQEIANIETALGQKVQRAANTAATRFQQETGALPIDFLMALGKDTPLTVGGDPVDFVNNADTPFSIGGRTVRLDPASPVARYQAEQVRLRLRQEAKLLAANLGAGHATRLNALGLIDDSSLTTQDLVRFAYMLDEQETRRATAINGDTPYLIGTRAHHTVTINELMRTHGIANERYSPALMNIADGLRTEAFNAGRGLLSTSEIMGSVVVEYSRAAHAILSDYNTTGRTSHMAARKQEIHEEVIRRLLAPESRQRIISDSTGTKSRGPMAEAAALDYGRDLEAYLSRVQAFQAEDVERIKRELPLLETTVRRAETAPHLLSGSEAELFIRAAMHGDTRFTTALAVPEFDAHATYALNDVVARGLDAFGRAADSADSVRAGLHQRAVMNLRAMLDQQTLQHEERRQVTRLLSRLTVDNTPNLLARLSSTFYTADATQLAEDEANGLRTIHMPGGEELQYSLLEDPRLALFQHTRGYRLDQPIPPDELMRLHKAGVFNRLKGLLKGYDAEGQLRVFEGSRLAGDSLVFLTRAQGSAEVMVSSFFPQLQLPESAFAPNAPLARDLARTAEHFAPGETIERGLQLTLHNGRTAFYHTEGPQAGMVTGESSLRNLAQLLQQGGSTLALDLETVGGHPYMVGLVGGRVENGAFVRNQAHEEERYFQISGAAGEQMRGLLSMPGHLLSAGETRVREILGNALDSISARESIAAADGVSARTRTIEFLERGGLTDAQRGRFITGEELTTRLLSADAVINHNLLGFDIHQLVGAGLVAREHAETITRKSIDTMAAEYGLEGALVPLEGMMTRVEEHTGLSDALAVMQDAFPTLARKLQTHGLHTTEDVTGFFDAARQRAGLAGNHIVSHQQPGIYTPGEISVRRSAENQEQINIELWRASEAAFPSAAAPRRLAIGQSAETFLASILNQEKGTGVTIVPIARLQDAVNAATAQVADRAARAVRPQLERSSGYDPIHLLAYEEASHRLRDFETHMAGNSNSMAFLPDDAMAFFADFENQVLGRSGAGRVIGQRAYDTLYRALITPEQNSSVRQQLQYLRENYFTSEAWLSMRPVMSELAGRMYDAQAPMSGSEAKIISEAFMRGIETEMTPAPIARRSFVGVMSGVESFTLDYQTPDATRASFIRAAAEVNRAREHKLPLTSVETEMRYALHGHLGLEGHPDDPDFFSRLHGHLAANPATTTSSVAAMPADARGIEARADTLLAHLSADTASTLDAAKLAVFSGRLSDLGVTAPQGEAELAQQLGLDVHTATARLLDVAARDRAPHLRDDEPVVFHEEGDSYARPLSAAAQMAPDSVIGNPRFAAPRMTSFSVPSVGMAAEMAAGGLESAMRGVAGATESLVGKFGSAGAAIGAAAIGAMMLIRPHLEDDTAPETHRTRPAPDSFSLRRVLEFPVQLAQRADALGQKLDIVVRGKMKKSSDPSLVANALHNTMNMVAQRTLGIQLDHDDQRKDPDRAWARGLTRKDTP